MRGSIALRTLAIALATPLLFVSNLSAEELSGSRIQAESLNPTNTTRVYNSIATPDGGSTPNALRHDTNVTVTYPVTVPADATVNAVVVRSKSAQTSTGSVSINVVVDGVAQTAKSIPASAQTYSDRTWMLASPLGPGTHQIGVRSTNTTTNNKPVNDYLFLDGQPVGVDTDSDGVADASDNCDSVANPSQAVVKCFASGSDQGAQNRAALLDLANSSTNVVLPPGDYPVNNSDPAINIQSYTGDFTMQEGAHVTYTVPTGAGTHFTGGTGLELYNWTSFHPATVRTPGDDALALTKTTDTLVDGAEIHGSGASGIRMGQTVRTTVQNSYVEKTMADGIHFGSSGGGKVLNSDVYWTGDDGIAFVRYAGTAPNGLTGGFSSGNSSTEAGARGMSVVGQSNVDVENFEIANSASAGIMIACEVAYNNCTNYPSTNIHFRDGSVTDAGTNHEGTMVNPNSIMVNRVNDNTTLTNITSVSPEGACYRTVNGGSATLTNVSGEGAGC